MRKRYSIFAGAILSPSNLTLSVISPEIQTDETGKATIEGEATADAVLTINGETVKTVKVLLATQFT